MLRSRSVARATAALAGGARSGGTHQCIAISAAATTTHAASITPYQPRRSFAYRPDPTPGESTKKPTVAVATAALQQQDPQQRAAISISEVLTKYQSDGRTFTCFASQSLYEAVQIMVASRVGCLVAMEEDGEHVAGLVTERDVLSEMVRMESSEDTSSSNWRTVTVAQAMTKSREMVHIKPTDRIDDALSLMTSQGFRHLPVLDSSSGANHLRGMVSMRNLVDIVYKHNYAGGKAQFLTDVLPRTGVPKNTSLRKKTESADSQAKHYRNLFLNAGVSSLNHPDKKHGEDAWIAFLGRNMQAERHMQAQQQEETGKPAKKGDKSNATASASSSSIPPQPLSIIGVFDGVGSWSFEQGIDPARFSNECARALGEFVGKHPSVTEAASKTAANDDDHTPPLTPSSMLDASWKSVTQHKIVGSSTACILSLGHESNELRGANIGDSGFLILRHRENRVRVGSVGHGAGKESSSSYQVIYRSPQQLHYFNCPLQLGIGLSGQADKFESPADADILVSPVQEGDLIVLATDGLFDNVPEEMIVQTIVEAMERVEKEATKTGTTTPSSNFQTRALNSTQSDPKETAGSPMKQVADALTKVAYDLSVDKTIDSPFAVLAKENNILWKNGGRKDDITVIVARVDAVTQ